ncbi:MAG: hypothetical protein H8E12_14760 [Rhodobacteraceae bacterium]|nr:hypothetical protein [Paracoccaceae bacterium]
MIGGDPSVSKANAGNPTTLKGFHAPVIEHERLPYFKAYKDRVAAFIAKIPSFDPPKILATASSDQDSSVGRFAICCK